MHQRLPPTILKGRNLVSMIRGSVGSEMFRHLYATRGGIDEVDLLRDGQVSCAYYVSTMLSMPNFALIPRPHATVDGLIKTLENPEFGWRKVHKPTREGDVLIWEMAAQAGGEFHLHAGFFLGGEMAMSHVDSHRSPQPHHYTFGGKRGIIAVYTHEKLA